MFSLISTKDITYVISYINAWSSTSNFTSQFVKIELVLSTNFNKYTLKTVRFVRHICLLTNISKQNL